jgi:cytochrome c-type biogenesis protein CcmH/NrfG
MQREPMIFFVAGMAFGCVLGYMVANAGGGAEPRPVPLEAPAATTGGPVAAAPLRAPRSSPPARGATPPDPNELHALESLASREPKNVEVRLQLGNLLMDHEQFADAVRWYQEAITIAPGNLDARVDLGACLVNSGKAAEGLAQFEQALKTNPNHKKALFNKGVALMESGRPNDAVAVWEDLIKRFPNDPQLAGLKEQIEQVRAQRAPS